MCSSKRFFGILLSALFIIFFIGCDVRKVFEENSEIPGSLWNKNQLVPFQFNITDTSLAYNIYLNVRHTGLYQYRNIWIKVYTTLPSGEKNEKLVELMLAEPSGKWLGSGMGDIWDNSILVQKNVKFPLNGEYKIELQHYMRKDILPFIMDVGVRVEKM